MHSLVLNCYKRTTPSQGRRTHCVQGADGAADGQRRAGDEAGLAYRVGQGQQDLRAVRRPVVSLSWGSCVP